MHPYYEVRLHALFTNQIQNEFEEEIKDTINLQHLNDNKPYHLPLFQNQFEYYTQIGRFRHLPISCRLYGNRREIDLNRELFSMEKKILPIVLEN